MAVLQRVAMLSRLGEFSISSTWGSMSVTHAVIGHQHLFDVPELSSGLSFEQMVGFSLVHILLGFLGRESWVRLN